MQSDRRTCHWPYVAALVLLLTLCVTVPIYWQSDLSTADGPRLVDEGLTAEDVAYASARDYLARYRERAANARPMRWLPISDNIEQLLVEISKQAAEPRPDKVRPAVDNPDLLSNFFDEVSASTFRRPEPAVPGPLATAVFASAGGKLADISTDPLAAAAARLTVVVGRGLIEAPSLSPRPAPAQMRLTDPRDRLALLPPRVPHVTKKFNVLTQPAPQLKMTQPAPPAAAANAYPIPWTAPTALLRQLEVLANRPETSLWARQTIDELERLADADELSDAEMTDRLSRLNTLAKRAGALAGDAGDDRLSAALLRVRWGLTRRLECWAAMRDITVASAGANRYAARLPAGDQTHGLAGQGTEPVDLQALSGNIESYERIRGPLLARTIAREREHLMASDDPCRRALAQQIEEHYRNANIRIAITDDFLSRYVSQPQPEVRAVHDHIAGTPVRGRSETVAKNRVKLEPSTGLWQVDLEADGVVSSNTVADGGKARLRTHGTTAFSAQKSIVVGSDGIHFGHSAVNADTRNRLMGVRSDFDWLPIVGDIVRNVAVDNYHKKQPRARAEVEHKVARRVEQQLDARTQDAVRRAEREVAERLTDPLREAGIELTPVELTTTSERLVARLRLAGKEQLGGHTPRPRAPSDSLASLQIHESAFTNAALALGLDGQQLTAPQIQELMRQKIPRLRDQPAIEAQEKTVFLFTERDAVSFRAFEGKLEIILTLRAVRFEGSVVQNFRVHSYYKPEINGLDAELVRDGALGIEGRLRTADRARMHGVFNKIFSEDRRIPMIRFTDSKDSRFDDLMITQLVLEDGWLGMAVGPTFSGRTAQESRVLR